MRIAVFPGTFNPFTKGHEEIVRRALPLFDQVIVLVANNPDKKTQFTAQERVDMIRDVFITEGKVGVAMHEGLTTEFCKDKNAGFMIRGLRSGMDFEYEKNIDFANKIFAPNIETIYLISSHENSMLSSSMVREIKRFGGDISKYLPEQIYRHYEQR